MAGTSAPIHAGSKTTFKLSFSDALLPAGLIIREAEQRPRYSRLFWDGIPDGLTYPKAEEIFTGICETCKDVFESQLELPMNAPLYVNHHNDVKTLRRSIESGCMVCTMFPSPDELESANHVVNSRCRIDFPRYWFYMPERVMGLQGRFVGEWIWSLNKKYPMEEPLNMRLSMTKFLKSQQTMALANRWVRKDINDPRLYLPTQLAPHSFHPTRILHLDWSCDQSRFNVRLIETDEYFENDSVVMDIDLIPYIDYRYSTRPDMHPRGKQSYYPGDYLTLSHRWSKTEGQSSVILTKQNYKQLQTSVPFEKLKRCFQDAIRVALHLDFEYLWIDSLCIIQDDPEDKVREIGTMDEVYSFAACNLAATGFDSGEEGLFTEDRQTGQVLRADDGSHLTWSNPYDNLFHDVQSAPLLTRGWVAQEMFLARQVLHFGRKSMFFENKNGIRTETLPDGWEGWSTASANPRSLHGWATLMRCGIRVRDVLSNPRMIDPVVCWRHVVEYYTTTDLTYRSDKCIAISGIAKVFDWTMQLRRGYRGENGRKIRYEDRRPMYLDYLAGMWNSWQSRDLLYQLAYAQDNGRADYVALNVPSWSWAAREGHVLYSPWQPLGGDPDDFSYYKLDHVIPLATVVNMIGDTGIPDDSRKDIRGEIHISGMLWRLVCEQADDFQGLFTLSNGEVMRLNVFPDHHSPTEWPTSFFAMPLFKTRNFKAKSSEVMVYEGILLHRKPPIRGQYRRIGYFYAFELFPSSHVPIPSMPEDTERNIHYGAKPSNAPYTAGSIERPKLHLINQAIDDDDSYKRYESLDLLDEQFFGVHEGEGEYIINIT